MVRNWGVLIFLVGAMLIYGAFNAAARPLVLTVAAVSKVTFIALVLSNGDRYLRGQAGMSILVDAVMVLCLSSTCSRLEQPEASENCDVADHRRGAATVPPTIAHCAFHG